MRQRLPLCCMHVLQRRGPRAEVAAAHARLQAAMLTGGSLKNSRPCGAWWRVRHGGGREGEGLRAGREGCSGWCPERSCFQVGSSAGPAERRAMYNRRARAQAARGWQPILPDNSAIIAAQSEETTDTQRYGKSWPLPARRPRACARPRRAEHRGTAHTQGQVWPGARPGKCRHPLPSSRPV